MTRYQHGGRNFRSILEAQWCAFFAEIGWVSSYEQLPGDYYLIDFVIHGEHPFALEVKPAVTATEYQDAQAKIDACLSVNDWPHDVVTVGLTPKALLPGIVSPGAYPVVGWYGRYNAHPAGGSRSLDWGRWTVCYVCRQPALLSHLGALICAPCGHARGGWPVEPHFLNLPWAQACNDVQWRPAA